MINRSIVWPLIVLILIACGRNGRAAGKVIAWGDNRYSQINVPSGLTNVVAISANGPSLALKDDGTVVSWGTFYNYVVRAYLAIPSPPGLSNVAAVAAGGFHGLALKYDGTVVAWGYTGYGYGTDTIFPSRLTNIVAIAAGYDHNLALKSDGRVVAWGDNSYGQTNVPPDLSNVVAISTSSASSLALKNDGTVVGWGSFTFDSRQEPVSLTAPPGLSDVVAVAAGGINLVLKSDGTVAGWGYNDHGYYMATNLPPSLTTVAAIAASDNHSLALKSDGTVVAWGDNSFGQTNVPSGLTNAVAVSAGGNYSLALIGDGSPAILLQPASRRIFSGREGRLFAFAVGSVPLNYQWQFNGNDLRGATNSTLTLASVQLADAGAYRLVASNSFGSIMSQPAFVSVIQGPPVIFSQPSNQLFSLGSDIVLKMVADGSGPFQYHWRLNGAEISGATNASLAISNADFKNAGIYTVMIVNPFGSLNSAPFQLSLALEYDFKAPSGPLIWFPITFQSSTSSTYFVTFDAYHFEQVQSSCTTSWTLDKTTRIFHGTESCTDFVEDYYFFLFGWVAGPVRTTNYTQSVSQPAPDWLDGHWRLDAQVIPNGNQVSGQASITLDNSNVLQFQLTGTNSPTSPKLMLVLQDSMGDNLTVRTYGFDMCLQSIKGNVAGQSVDSVATSLLALTVHGSGTVQSFTNGQALVLGNDYTLTATPRPGNLFSNWVVGDLVTNNATLQFTMSSNLAITANFVTNLPPAVTLQPQSQTVIAGTNVAFNASASGTAPLKFQWRLNGVNITGATNADYLINNVQPPNGGNYLVVASNSAGNATSIVAVLTVLSPPAVTVPPQSQSIRTGASVGFTVAATGSAPLSYQWKFNGINIPGATGASYALSGVQLSNAGTYTVMVSNLTRIVTSATASLYVDSPLIFTSSALTTNGRFQGQLLGLAATNYVIQACSDLVNWVSISTNISTTGVISFTDTNRTSDGRRFYRARLLDRQTPTLTIIAPAPGQRWSNAVFIVKGTANDDMGVASVWYQLNGATWTLATSTNGFTNWTANVTLAPGTNTVKAYARDVVGKNSTTNTVSLVYVATNRLLVTMSGNGTLSPNYSNAWLEIGRGYSMVASGVNGHVFRNWVISTNWAGGMANTSATLTFMMQSNLTVQVNFTDVTKPTVAITNPAPNARLSNAVVTVKGTASDNARVEAVWYQLNGAAWNPALTTNGWTNWTATVGLIKDTNVVRVYSVDASGNASTTNSISFVSSNAFRLRLGFGSSHSLTNGGLELSLDVSLGLSGTIEGSANLVNWTPLTNFVSTSSPIYFRDSGLTNNDRRFYRAVVP